MPPPISQKKRNHLRRWIRRASISAGILVIAIPLATLREVDREPWDQKAEASVALAAASEMHLEVAAAQPAPLVAGWAKQRLPTEVGIPLAGYGARRNAVATALGDPLFASALYLRSGENEIVFVTADLLLIHPLVAGETVKLCAENDIAESALFFTATHTHCGPGAWAPGFIEQFVCGDFDPDMAKKLAASLAKAIVMAKESASAAEWTFLETEAPAHVRNRTVKGGPTDPTLEAIAVRKVVHTNKDTHPVALFAFYGAHATCFGHRRLAFSPDYPGAFVRDLESTPEVAFAAFAAGCVGSQSPAGVEGDSATRATTIGTNLARLLSKEIGAATWKREVALATSRHTLPILPLQLRLNPSTRLAPYVTDPIHPQEAPFHLARLDGHYFAGVAAEFSALLSAPLRAEAKAASKTLTITPFNGDYIGYVLPADLYDSSAYEATMNFQGPGGGEFFSALIRAGAGIPYHLLGP